MHSSLAQQTLTAQARGSLADPGRPSSLSERVKAHLQRFFARLGTLVTARPYAVIAVATVLSLGVGLFASRMQKDFRLTRIYVPQRAEGFRLAEEMDAHFRHPGTEGVRAHFMLMAATNGKTILNAEGMSTLLELHGRVSKLAVAVNATRTIRYDDVCWRPCATCDCFVPPLVRSLRERADSLSDQNVARIIKGCASARRLPSAIAAAPRLSHPPPLHPQVPGAAEPRHHLWREAARLGGSPDLRLRGAAHLLHRGRTPPHTTAAHPPARPPPARPRARVRACVHAARRRAARTPSARTP